METKKEKQTVDEIACKKYSIKEGLNDYEENHFNSTNVNLAKAFIEGYTQCQEDMADKKYTEEDIIKAIAKHASYIAFIDGYTKCQEDMADKKYTKAQMKACFYHNCIDNAKVIFDDYLKKYVTD